MSVQNVTCAGAEAGVPFGGVSVQNVTRDGGT